MLCLPLTARGIKEKGMEEGEKRGEKDSMGGVAGHTKTLRQCVLERGEWREVIEMLG